MRVQFEVFVRKHLELFLVQGTGLCALVLSEGRGKGRVLEGSLAPLQRRYTAPLMALLARGQAQGEVRSDVPLRLLRPLVLGPLEHLLWDLVELPEQESRHVDLEGVAQELVPLLWAAIAAPAEELARLRRLRGALQDLLHSA